MLENIVGKGHVKPKVTLVMNFDTIQKRSRNMTPVYDKDNKPLPIATKSLRERNKEMKAKDEVSGLPGVDSNTKVSPGESKLPELNSNGQQGQATPEAQPSPEMALNYKDTDQTTLNFNNEEQLVTPAMGSIQKMTISVAYQYGVPKVGGEEEAGAEEGAVKKLAEDDISKIVKDTVGFEQTRGDSITVKEVIFDDTMAKMLAEQIAKADAAKRLIPWWVALIAGIVALIVGAGIGGALLSKKAPPPDMGGFAGGVPGGEYAAIPGPGGPPGGAIPPPGDGPEVAAPQDRVEVSRAPVTPAPDNPFGFLYGIESGTVANLLSSERLPTLVAVLAQLDPGQADEVITLLNPEIQSEVRSRLSNNPVLPPMTQKMVSQSLKKRLQSITASV